VTREQVRLPGLDGVWRLSAAPGLDLSGPAEPMGRAFGRGGVLRAGSVVLRPYRRGGLIRHINQRIYAGPGRFQDEFEVHRALWAAGLPTVEPLGWACRPRLWGMEGVFLTRFAEAAPWPRDWQASPAVLPQLEILLGALCGWGLLAPDLNATNILVTAAGGILALDWDRACWAPGPGLARRYRQRLLQSLEKLGAPAEVRAGLGPT
jgi:hypothetical protein